MSGGAITQKQYKSLRELPEIKELDAQIADLKRAQQAEIKALPEYAQIKETDTAYIQRLDKIKKELGAKTMTIESLEQIDPEFAQAYKKLLAAQKEDGSNFLLNPEHHNEILVSNPKITALYTDDINNIPEEYLRKAQEEGLPIVIIKA